MEDKAPIIIAPLIIVLLTAHLSQDVVYGFEQGDIEDLFAAALAGVWLYFTMTLAGRRAGYLLLLVGAFLAPVVSIAHMSGDGVRDDLPAGEGFFFVWTLVGVGVAPPCALLTSIRGLWRLRTGALSFLLWTVVPVGLGASLLAFIIFKLNYGLQ